MVSLGHPLLSWRDRARDVHHNHTRAEVLPAEIVELITDLTAQVLQLRVELTQLKTDIGKFYTRLGDKVA